MDQVKNPKNKIYFIICLLVYAFGEKSHKAKTPRFSFKQKIIHADYLYFLYFTFLIWGYTNYKLPIPLLTKDSKGKKNINILDLELYLFLI